MLKNLILIALFGIAVALIAAGGAAYWLLQPVSPSTQPTQAFIIPKGQAISIIGNRLAEAGYIKHPLVFRYVVQQQQLADDIQAGTFQISTSMTPAEIAQVMTSGTEDVWVTIQEGWRTEEIAAMLARQELPEFDEDEFIKIAKGSEGYLYPDTYLVPRLMTTQGMYELLTDTFDTKINQGLADDIASFDKDIEEVMVMASIVERESRGYEEMQMVAGILWNRIEVGMPLQVDATLQYLKGYNQQQESWWVPPLASYKEIDSPYNTYKNTGLPPRPISNPGIDAIKATLNPIDSDYVFYLHDGQGQIRYGRTLQEHNQNVEEYLR